MLLSLLIASASAVVLLYWLKRASLFTRRTEREIAAVLDADWQRAVRVLAALRSVTPGLTLAL